MKIRNIYLDDLKEYSEFDYKQWYDSMNLSIIFKQKSISSEELMNALPVKDKAQFIMDIILNEDDHAIVNIYYYNGLPNLINNYTRVAFIDAQLDTLVIFECDEKIEPSYSKRYAINKFLNDNSETILSFKNKKVIDIFDKRSFEGIYAKIQLGRDK